MEFCGVIPRAAAEIFKHIETADNEKATFVV